ncbi:hypothetical protein H6G89_11805 [Oscillatoria sp. FACHB-1407]|uniref:hypothetical protein n=1 Tax=Oscillatoria sp. FACHB-1407 TaxID=2692847 RepID=UPI001681D124|nr:hypothetical protein [Oscillatoria sp. FACHB-1407]MBD2461737.1 hypothetical protein [Oscillatoria sp. FACHB-1407]
MVERPIKKSERQAIAQSSEEGGEAQGTELTAKRDTPKPVRAKDKPPGGKSDERRSDDRKSKGKGKGGKRGSRDDDQPKAPANLATMRGPRPVKAQPEPEPVVDETPTDESLDEALTEETTDEATEGVESEA